MYPRIAIGALIACAAIGCGSEVALGPTGSGGGSSTGGSAAGGMGPDTLPSNCTEIASPLSSTNAYDALRCAGLVHDGDFLLQLYPDQQGSLDANGVSQVWGFDLGRATTGAVYLVGIVHFDGAFLVEPPSSEILDTECTAADGIPLLDSQVVLPDAASRLPPGSVFEKVKPGSAFEKVKPGSALKGLICF